MFGLGLHPAFLIVLFIIVLIVFGPGKLPEMASAAGRMVREFRRASDEVTGELRRALDLPEGQGASMFSAQGIFEQLTREPEVPTAIEATVPLATEDDATEAEAAPEAAGAAEVEVESYDQPEIDPSVFGSSHDGTEVAGKPFEEAMPAGDAGHEPSSAVTSPSEELPAVGQQLAAEPDPVGRNGEAASGEPAAKEPQPVRRTTRSRRPVSRRPRSVRPPSATVEAVAASPEAPTPQPTAGIENPPGPEEGGGDETGEATA